MFSLQKISVSFYFLSLPLLLLGGEPYLVTSGAVQAGMGYVSVTKPGFWSSFHNQALSCLGQDKIEAGFSYENRYGLKELSTTSAAAVIRAGKTSLSCIYSDFGYADFRRRLAGAGCSMPVSERIMAGIQVDYLQEKSYGDYLDNQALTFEAGLVISATDDLNIGLHLFNPVPNSMRKNKMPSAVTAGIGGFVNRNVFAAIETQMTSLGEFDIRTGFEYAIAGILFLRGGFRTLHNSFSFGAGFITGPVQVDLAFASHEILGISSCVSITLRRGKNVK